MKKRPVQTMFYRSPTHIVQVNRSSCSNKATANAFRHMQTNRYDAKYVEVFNSETGKLYAVLRWTKLGTVLETLYRDTIEEFNHGR